MADEAFDELEPVVDFGEPAPFSGGSNSGVRRVAFAPGSVIDDKYAVVRVIGTGGWATVYEAEHIDLGHHVAIKLMNGDEVYGDELVERFRREARISASVRHPNLLEVFDVGRAPDGRPYLVMELLDGEDLDRRIGRGPLPVAAVVDVGRQLLAGLAALADRRIVHRDIKPHNVMLHEQGDETVVKLVDFGLSKTEERPVGWRTLTSKNVLLGTPHYMSPEQARGEPLDCRSDLYAVGVVLYEALTGVVPFDAPTPSALFAAILRDAPKPPSELRPDCPPELERVLLRALAKEREARHSHPRELGAELAAIQHAYDLATGSAAWLAPAGTPPLELSRRRDSSVERSDAPTPDADGATLPASPGDDRAGFRLPVDASVGHWARFGIGASAVLAIAILIALGPGTRRGILSMPLIGEKRVEHAETPQTDLVPQLAAAELAIAPASNIAIAQAAAVEAETALGAEAMEGEPARERARRTAQPATREVRAGARPSAAGADAAPAPPATSPAAAAAARDLTARALGSYVRGQFPRARVLYRRAIALDSNHAEAWRGLGLVEIAMGRPAEGRRALTRYLRIAPRAPDAAQIRARLEALND